MFGGAPKLIALVGLATTVLGAPPRTKYAFKPESAKTYKNPYVPALIDLTQSQYDWKEGSSYWSSSYVTSTKGEQYLAISHILTPKKNVCRSSILDLTTLDYVSDVSYCKSAGNKAQDTSGRLNADFGNYGFVATTDDNVAGMYTHVKTDKSFSFNVSWEATSKVLLNGGGGVFAFGDGPSNATEWTIPASKTTGNLNLNGKDIEIDPTKSFTWYDRQITYGGPRNWTWFALSFPGTELRASIWSYELGPPTKTNYQFATVRDGNSQYVLAYDLEPEMSNVWVSPRSKLVYPLSWKLKFENGDYLVVTSVRPDQEMYGPEDVVDSAYEGFVSVSGNFLGQKRGYGVVEMVTVYELEGQTIA